MAALTPSDVAMEEPVRGNPSPLLSGHRKRGNRTCVRLRRVGGDLEKREDRDAYYLGLAEAVLARANCFGREVGAVLVKNQRVISTGYNGTPAGFKNCREGGCIRCHDHEFKSEATSPETLQGKSLDLCFCVHAEQNALLNAARHGISVDEATLYATHQPCFTCLKESVQAGVERVVYLEAWHASQDEQLMEQYYELTKLLPGEDEADGFAQFDRGAYDEFRQSHPTLDSRGEAAKPAKPELELVDPGVEPGASETGFGVDPNEV